MISAPPPFISPLVVREEEPQRDLAGEIIYPCTDGLPMTWTTLHYRWLVFLKEGFEALFAERNDVFIAGDVFWYPTEGNPSICVAPDVFIALGRPKGERSSYKQWQEDGVAPQVVFEVLSEGNTIHEMHNKMRLYSTHGVQEYVIYDPNEPSLDIWQRDADNGLKLVTEANGWTSPLLGVTYWLQDNGHLAIIQPDGTKMLHPEGHVAKRIAAEARANAEAARANALAAKLRELGIDPDTIS